MEMNINTFEQLHCECISKKNKAIYEVAQEKYMASSADISVDEVRAFTNRSLFAMKEAIQTGMLSRNFLNERNVRSGLP